MKGLFAAIAIRRRRLDDLRQALDQRQRRLALIDSTIGAERASLDKERPLAQLTPVAADAWFQASATRLTALAAEQSAVSAELQRLRAAAGEARARLSLLEDAAADARLREQRRREGQVQAALDDRTAAAWCRR